MNEVTLQLAPLTTMNPLKGRRPVPANARVDELLVDAAYQRELPRESVTLIRRIAKDWDWTLCQPLIVARRTDDLYVVDGQHRLAAAKLRGDILDLPCVIIESRGPQEEAKTFVALNQVRRPLTPFALYRAAVAAGDEDAVRLAAILADNSLQVVGTADWRGMQPGAINCINAVRGYFRSHGEQSTRDVLEVLASAFAGKVQTNSGSMFTAIGRFLRTFKVAKPKLIEVLSRRTQAQWYASALNQAAVAGVDRSVAFEDVLWAAYYDRALADRRAPYAPAIAATEEVTKQTQVPAVKPRRSFEEQLAAVSGGAPIVAVAPVPTPDVPSGGSSLG